MKSAPKFTKAFLDRLELGDLLGEGGMGWVFRGRLRATQRPVAIKVLKESGADDLARFRREAGLLVGLDHPGIVDVIEFGVDGGHPYLVMELIDGRELGGALGPPPVDVKRAREVLGQVADALAFLHARGIVHRDVKPENILMCSNGRVCLVDFGLARNVQAGQTITKTGIIMGTPAYMAPEQVEGAVVGPAADQYALGVVAFELLAARLPFAGDDALSQAAARLTQKAPPLRTVAPRVPAQLEEIVGRMLARNPSDRFDDLATVARYLGGSATAPVPTLKMKRPANGDRVTASVRAAPGRGRKSWWWVVPVAATVAMSVHVAVRPGALGPVTALPGVSASLRVSARPTQAPVVYMPLDSHGLDLCEQILDACRKYKSDRVRQAEDINVETVQRDSNLPDVAPTLMRGLQLADQLQSQVAAQKLKGPVWLVVSEALEGILACTSEATGHNGEYFPSLVKSLSDRSLVVYQRRPLHSDFHHDKVVVPLLKISMDLAKGALRGGFDRDVAARDTLLLIMMMRKVNPGGWRHPTELDQWLRILTRSIDWADQALATGPDTGLLSYHAGRQSSLSGRRELVALLRDVLASTPSWLAKPSPRRARLLATFKALVSTFEPALAVPPEDLRSTATVLDRLLEQCGPEDRPLIWDHDRPMLGWSFHDLAVPGCRRLGMPLMFEGRFPVPPDHFRRKPVGGFRSARGPALR